MSFYDAFFLRCEQLYNPNFDFDGFRNSQEFFFLDNRTPTPDTEALNIGMKIDKALMEKYLQVKKSKLGYKNAPTNQYSDCDQLDSRHYMMSCFIFSYLNSIGFNTDNILEIGGGFGNWCYINQDIINYKKWNILDIPFVTDLQNWFINKDIKDTSRINLISFSDNTKYKNFVDDTNKIDLIIASHSLSEVNMEIFQHYVDKILPKTQYLFYAYSKIQHNKQGNPQDKINILDKHFLKVKEITSENGVVSNIIYKKNI